MGIALVVWRNAGLGVVGVMMLLGCAPYQSTTRKTEGSQPPSIATPATPQDILRNIKSAVQSNVLLREEIYTEEGIKRLIGVDAVQLMDQLPGKQRSAIVRSSKSNCIDGLVAVWLTTVGPGGARIGKAKIQFNFSLRYSEPACSVLNADLARGFFGEPARVRSFFPLASRENLHRDLKIQLTTHPLGNADVEFVLATSPVSKQLQLEVLGSGIIRSIQVRMEEL